MSKSAFSLVLIDDFADTTKRQQTKFGSMPCGHLREVPLSAGFFYARDFALKVSHGDRSSVSVRRMKRILLRATARPQLADTRRERSIDSIECGFDQLDLMIRQTLYRAVQFDPVQNPCSA